MLASFPASMVNQKLPDLGIPNRFKLNSSRFSARDKLRSKHLPKRRIFLSPPYPHQREHSIGRFLFHFGPGPFFPTDRKASQKNQM
jgi:hypothetical protein